MRRQKFYIVRRNEIKHSAKGSTWKDHKYIKKVGDKYIYADTKNGEGDETSNSTNSDTTSAEKKDTNTENTSASQDNTNKEFDIEEMANKVIRGEFGNGADRKELLGESYKEIQNRVNEILLGEDYVKSKLEKQKSKSDEKESKSDKKESDEKKQ